MSDTRVKGRLEYVLGGTPLGVVIRLLVMSFVVGLVLTVLDVNPNDIIVWIEDRLRFLTSFGFETFEEAGAIILLGAVVVIPVWVVLRILRLIGR
ncbi:MAG: hypothetical protein AcusKO_41500 [Acuticoccus sp.]